MSGLLDGWDPGEEWFRHVREDLIPKIESSGVSAAIVPENPKDIDIKMAVELGLMILFDKPIALIIQPGQQVPEHLTRAADAIIEYGPGMGEALAEFAERHG